MTSSKLGAVSTQGTRRCLTELAKKSGVVPLIYGASSPSKTVKMGCLATIRDLYKVLGSSDTIAKSNADTEACC